ncbi:MAG: MFS transporter [Betaproteobacteria bacterium]
MTRSTAWRLVPALGITQIVSWGTLYYAIAVLGASMRVELGVSATVLFGAYSLALLISALAAPFVGRAIDRHGGRVVMSAGSACAAIALVLIAQAHSTLALYLAWSVAGIAMAMTMYDAAFATLSQHAGTSYRKALTALTLMGGLASTAFWPASLKGLEWFGWRDTLLIFAALELFLCLPLHLLFIPASNGAAGQGKAGAAEGRGILPAGKRRPAFVWLAIAFALNGFIVSVLTVHLITVLQGKGLSLATAVWVGSFFGPMQVTGRLLEFSIGRRFASRSVGIAALSLLVVAVLVLLALDGQLAVALLFAVVFGGSNGVVTIVRGTVPAELFGRAGYGSILGNLAAPALFARAIAPFVFAPFAVAESATVAGLLALLAMAILSVACFGIAVKRAQER